jgi:uncharacterized membrane protein (Fun14 family)
MTTNRRKNYLTYKFAAGLAVLWLIGLISGYTLEGFIHVMLAVAVLMVLTRFVLRAKLT